MAHESEGGLTEAQRPYLRFLVLEAMFLGLLVLLGYVPTQRLGGDGAVVAMLAGCGVSLAASIAGTVPVLLLPARSAGDALPAAMGAMVTRFVVALAVALAVALSGWVAPKPFLIWVAIAYAALLVPETLFVNRRAVQDPTLKPD